MVHAQIPKPKFSTAALFDREPNRQPLDAALEARARRRSLEPDRRREPGVALRFEPIGAATAPEHTAL
ncbi:MAG TPA: hypothetical protein VGM56_09645, partial [Byssovorax sp.]